MRINYEKLERLLSKELNAHINIKTKSRVCYTTNTYYMECEGARASDRLIDEKRIISLCKKKEFSYHKGLSVSKNIERKWLFEHKNEFIED